MRLSFKKGKQKKDGCSGYRQASVFLLFVENDNRRLLIE